MNRQQAENLCSVIEKAVTEQLTKSWDEADHPRDERGRFTSGGGSDKGELNAPNKTKTLDEAVSYGIETKAVGIMEHNGAYQAASTWDEIKYAEKLGWKYVGHPTDLKTQ